MKVAVYKSLWGMTGTLEENLGRIAEAGYEGVETALRPEIAKALPGLLPKHKLGWIGMMFTGGNTVEEHIASFREQLASTAGAGPVKITCHSSRDKFSWDEQVRFYEAAMGEEGKCGVKVNHETHRGRALFTPWTTAALLKRFPGLHLCADFSHWACVCESLMDDQAEAMELAVSRTRHIHSRVGYEEGPQVTDPAAPEFKRHLERHLLWWDGVIAQQRKAGAAEATITPEFGPPNYQHTVPYTNQPLTDLWQTCLWMAKLLRERYSAAT